MCGINYPYPETCPRATCCDLMREQERLNSQKILCKEEYRRGFREWLEVVRNRYFYGQPETIKIGNLEYNKSEVEEALRDIKPINN